jgi:hypothetical protein
MTAQLSHDSPLLGAARMVLESLLAELWALTSRKKRYFFEPVLLWEPVL